MVHSINVWPGYCAGVCLTLRNVILVVSMLALAGCVTSDQVNDVVAEAIKKEKRNSQQSPEPNNSLRSAEQTEFPRITPDVIYQIDTPARATPLPDTVILNSYTRLKIRQESCAEMRDKKIPHLASFHEENCGGYFKTRLHGEYEKSRKSGNLKRFLHALFGDDALSMTLNAKLSVSNPQLLTTKPLLSMGLQDGKQGLNFSAEVSNSLVHTPYFRLEPNTVVGVSFHAKAANDVNIRAASILLESITALTSVVDPGASLLTTLNKNDMNNRAERADALLGELFSREIQQEVTSQLSLKDWPHGRSLRIVFRDMAETERSYERYPGLASWVVELDPPRPSVFSSVRYSEDCLRQSDNKALCQKDLKRAYADFRPAEIRSYKLLPQTSLQNHLDTKQDWYSKGLTAFVAADRGNAESFCRHVIDELTGLGLTSSDALAGLVAVLHGPNMPFAARDQFESLCPTMAEAWSMLRHTGTLMDAFGSSPELVDRKIGNLVDQITRQRTEKSCDMNSVDTLQACYSLAEMEAKGFGGLKDLKLARDRFASLCKNRNMLAACEVFAGMARDGQGGKDNINDSNQAFSLACLGGRLSACLAWGTYDDQMEKTLQDNCLNQNDIKACAVLSLKDPNIGILETACIQGKFALACTKAAAKASKPDKKTEYLEQACALDQQSSCSDLAKNIASKDPKRALMLKREACNEGYVEACR